MIRYFVRLIALTGALLYLSASFAGAAPADIALVVDTSAPAEQLQPARDFIDRFVDRLPPDSRTSVITFDHHARVLAALGTVVRTGDAPVSARLLDTPPEAEPGVDTAAGLERAIYELRVRGRAGAGKFIVVIGNGGIDTGDATRDDTLNAWLRDDLAKESRQAGIRIFWLTTSEAADYRLVQTITRDTDGDYYRIFGDTDRAAALDGLTAALATGGPVQNAVVTAPTGSADKPAASRSGFGTTEQALLVAAGTLTTMVALGIVLLRKRSSDNRPRRPGTRGRRRVGSRVELRDISGFTGQGVYDITGRRTFVGRQPREVTRSNFVIVIPDQAISRSHATIEFKDNGYWIEDTGSVNGTFVNDRRLESRHLLRNGDRIRFAKFEFEFILPPSAPNERDAPADDADVHGPHTTTDTSDDDRTVIRPRARQTTRGRSPT